MASGFKFESNIPAIQKQLNQIAERAMEKVCLMIEAAIKSGAPVMTGGLRDSINHRIKGSGAQITGQIGTPLMYGVYVEFGTGDFAENGAGRKSGKTPEGSQAPQGLPRPRWELALHSWPATAEIHAQRVSPEQGQDQGHLRQRV